MNTEHTNVVGPTYIRSEQKWKPQENTVRVSYVNIFTNGNG